MRRSIFFFYFFILLYSCNPVYRAGTIQYQNYIINSDQQRDSSFINLLQPYSDSLNKTMNDVLADVAVRMEKKQPESTLGNFLADAYLFMAREKFNNKADLALMAPGGIRLPSIEAGKLRKGTVYEVMPFDNLMILVSVKGELLKKYFDSIAAEGGTGIAGFSMVIRNKKATDIKINGTPFDTSAIYIVVNSDYSVNNPDAAWLYKDAPRQHTGYLMRDAIIDYARHLNDAGKTIGHNLQNRITNAD